MRLRGRMRRLEAKAGIRQAKRLAARQTEIRAMTPVQPGMTRYDTRVNNSNSLDQDRQAKLPDEGRDAPRRNMVRKETAIRFNLERFLRIVLVEDHE